MLRVLAVCVALGALAAPAFSQPDEAPAPAAECTALPEALRGCAPAACLQPHPFMRGFQITHRVIGADGEACAYTQTMPGDMTMSCRFSEDGRVEMAASIEEMLTTGAMSGSTSAPANAMTRECEIRGRDGAVIPWGDSRD